jgi:hypothetical protein
LRNGPAQPSTTDHLEDKVPWRRSAPIGADRCTGSLTPNREKRDPSAPAVMAGLDPAIYRTTCGARRACALRYEIHTSLPSFPPSSMALKRRKPWRITAGPGLP